MQKTGYCIGMMKKYYANLLIFAAAGMMFLCGCGPSAPEGTPPAERNALVIRMFHSMEKGDALSAAAQAAKVRAMDPGNAYFSWIIEVQECNQAIARAQTALDAGRLAEAEEILFGASRRYPLQPSVATELKKVRQLRQLQAAVKMYCAARDAAGREYALKTVSRQAEQLRDPVLVAQCNALRKQLEAEVAADRAAQKTAEPPALPVEQVRKP